MSAAAPSVPVADLAPYEILRSLVGRRAAVLQTAYLDQSGQGAAVLAKLRRAMSSATGADPSIWADTIGLLEPPLAGTTDQASRAENATHVALTLFALHQQSRRLRMHQVGIGLGAAVRRLAQSGASPEAVTRRFHMLGTSQTFAETTHHARGLISQLRAAEIPLDYGQFAVDLYFLQFPTRASSVLLTWGRDFHCGAKEMSEADSQVPSSSPTAPNGETL